MFRPKYSITNRILRNVGLIEAAKEMIDNAPLVPAWELQFKQEAMVRAVHYGTHVEGNDLTLEQAERVVRQEPQRHESAADVAERAGVVARDRDIQEVINYRNVMKYLERLVDDHRKSRKDFFVYTLDQLMTIHAMSVERIVPPNEAGVFRNQQVVIKGVEAGEIVHRPPNPVEVSYQIDDFLVWLNHPETRELHSVLKAGITHYELSRIHPFIEGNGRTARAMMLLIMEIDGVDARRFFSIEEHFDKNVHEYYRASKEVADLGGDMTPWLDFFAESLAVEMNKIKDKIKKLSMDNRLKGRMGKQVALKERQIVLIEYLEKNEWLMMNDARELLPMVSDDTILRDLRDLMKKGLIKKKGKTKGARYTLKV